MVIITSKYQLMYGERLAMLAFAFIIFVFGINFIFVGISNRELPPFWGAALRYFLASIILWGIVSVKNIELPNRKLIIGAILYGLLAFAGNAGLLYWGLKSTTPATASVIFASTPLITLIISNLCRLEKITVKGIVSGLIVALGIYLIFSSQLAQNISLISILAIVAACVFAAISTIVLKTLPKINPIITNAIGMTAGAQSLLVMSLIAGETIILPHLLSTWSSLAWLVISSSSAFILLSWIISKWKVSKVSYTSVLYPLVTVGASLFIAHQEVPNNFLLGSLIVLIGSYVCLTGPKSIKYNYKIKL